MRRTSLLMAAAVMVVGCGERERRASDPTGMVAPPANPRVTAKDAGTDAPAAGPTVPTLAAGDNGGLEANASFVSMARWPRPLRIFSDGRITGYAGPLPNPGNPAETATAPPPRLLEGRIPAEELAELARFATSSEFIADLRSPGACDRLANGFARIDVEVEPGLMAHTPGKLIGCSPLYKLAEARMNWLAARYLTGGGAGDAPAALPGTTGAARIVQRPMVFVDYNVMRETRPCPTGESCQRGTHIFFQVNEREVIVIIGRWNKHGVVPLAALSDFAALATSDRVIAALRATHRGQPCPPRADLIEEVQIGIGPGLTIGGEIAGCQDGPLAELRLAEDVLVGTHTAAPANP